MRALALIVLILVLLLGAGVGYFNSQLVSFNYLAGEVQIPLIALIVAEFAVAVLLTLLVCFGRIFSLKSEVRRLRKQLREADAELKNLRDIPLRDVPPVETPRNP